MHPQLFQKLFLFFKKVSNNEALPISLITACLMHYLFKKITNQVNRLIHHLKVKAEIVDLQKPEVYWGRLQQGEPQCSGKKQQPYLNTGQPASSSSIVLSPSYYLKAYEMSTMLKLSRVSTGWCLDGRPTGILHITISSLSM